MTASQPQPPAPGLSVVVPVHNERDNIAPLVAEIVAALRGRLAFEIVYVDDHSADDSLAVLRSLKAQVPELRVLHHAAQSGQSAAVRNGVKAARGAWIATLDGDGQNDPADIPRLLAARDAAAPEVKLFAGDMDPAKLEELSASIQAQGVIQPIVVREIAPDRYEIVAGERRWRASQLAGLAEVPVVLRELDDRTVIAMALIENIQREDLNPLEEAQALQRLIDEFSLTHAEAAAAVGDPGLGAAGDWQLHEWIPQDGYHAALAWRPRD